MIGNNIENRQVDTLYYTQSGQGEDLVLLHGWGAHGGVWADIARDLEQNYRVTVIDLPGFGQSPMLSGTFDFDSVLSAVLQVAPDRAIYLGWSLGGLIATGIALQAPERVNKLITVASSPCFVSGLDWMGMAPQLLAKFSEQLRHDYVATLRRFIALQFHGLECDRKAIRALEDHLLSPAPHHDALIAGLQLLEQVDLRDQLSSITCPMVGIFGRLDAMVPVMVADQVVDLNPNYQRIVMDQSAHIPFITHPEAFLTHLRGVI